MPRMGDMFPQQRGGNDVHSPLRGLLDFTSPLDDTVQQAGDQIRGKIDDVVAFISETTGIDLSGVNALLDVLEGATGLDFLGLGGLDLPNIFPDLLSTLEGIPLGDPGAILAAIESATETLIIGPIQDVIDFIIQPLTGSSATGNPAHLIAASLQKLAEASSTAGNSAAEAWQLAANAIAIIDSAFNDVVQPVYTDTAAAITAGQAAIGALVGTAINAETQAVGWIAGFFNSITGQTQTGVTIAQAAEQAAALAEAQAAAAVAIANQQAAADGAATGGLASSDDFERVATTNLNGPLAGAWATTTIASGGTPAGYWAIADGHTAKLVVGNPNVTQLDLHRRTLAADAQTETLYQKVGVIIGGFTGDGAGFGLGTPRFRIRSRLNTAETQEVFCWVSVDGKAQFGYRNGSTVDNLIGSPVDVGVFSPGTAFYLLAGNIGGVRQFQLLKGADASSVVAAWNDTGALTAAVQGTNNGWGWGGYTYPGGGIPQRRPPDVGIVTIADNTAVSVLGNGFRVYRTNTGSVTLSAGSALPGGFFDTADAVSTKCPFNYAAGTFTVPAGLAGFWSFDIGIASSGLPGGSKWVPTLLVGGTVRINGNEYLASGTTKVKETFRIYLNVGDVVSIGLLAGTAAMFGFGDAAGVNTFLSGVLSSGSAAA